MAISGPVFVIAREKYRFLPENRSSFAGDGDFRYFFAGSGDFQIKSQKTGNFCAGNDDFRCFGPRVSALG